MDPLTQGLLGGALALSVANKKESRLATAIGFTAALPADADILIGASDDPLLDMLSRELDCRFDAEAREALQAAGGRGGGARNARASVGSRAAPNGDGDGGDELLDIGLENNENAEHDALLDAEDDGSEISGSWIVQMYSIVCCFSRNPPNSQSIFIFYAFRHDN